MTVLLASLLVGAPQMPIRPLTRAHSHNDYAQKRPFDEAVDNGFNSIEVDVFPVNGKLLVGHNEKDIKPEKTIESMYLDKLSARVKANKGSVYAAGAPTFWVLVDVKRDGLVAYKTLRKILDRYPNLMPNKSKVRFVISGDRAIDAIAADKGKYAGIDGRFPDLAKHYSFEVMPWISDDWLSHFKWLGAGAFPADSQKELTSLVKSVHDQKKLIRFWGTADNEQTWELQWKAGADLINTDKPKKLRIFMLNQPRAEN